LYGSGLLQIDSAISTLQTGGLPNPSADACGNTPLTPTPPPALNAIDLRVASVDVSGASVDPQTFQLTGTAAVAIANWGDLAPASTFTITLFKDGDQDGIIDPLETLTSFVCNPTNNTACKVAPFGAATFNVPLAGTLDFRDQRISAFVDAQAQIVEKDETNNVGLSLGACGGGQAITMAPVLKWSASLPALEIAAPIVADLNQDGLPEVIVVEAGTIRALSGKTGLAVPFFTPASLSATAKAGPSVAVANLDSDPFLEIVAADQDGSWPVKHTLRAFEHDGTLKWVSAPLARNMYHPVSWWSPTLADLDHDGMAEVIGPGRILSGSTGQVVATLTTGAMIGGSAIAVNLDSDPELEVVIGGLAFNSNGTTVWSNANQVGGYNAVADLDGDGKPDIIHVPHTTPSTPTTSIRVYRGSDGAALPGWTVPSTPSASLTGPPAVADVDGDGMPEVAVVGMKKLLVYRKDGSLRWALAIAEPNGTQGVTAFDFNRDGRWELVLNDGATLMIVADVGGVPVVAGAAPSTNQTWHEYPVVADIDGDGHAEIVERRWDFGGGSLRAYENAADNWPATRAIWNQEAYHAENVGSNGQAPISLGATWWADNQFLVNPQPVSLGVGPDLTAGRIIATGSQLSAVIGNAGDTAVTPVWVTFFDGAPNAGGVAIGSVNVGALAPGAFVTATVAHALTGSHDIYVVADRNYGVEYCVECVETNNIHNRVLKFPPPAEVALSKSVSTTIVPVGQPAFYLLQVANLSAFNSSNTVVTDTLPAGVQVSSISYSPSGCAWNSSQVGQVITFTRPSGIPAGTTCTIRIDFVATSATPLGTITNKASLTDTSDANPGNNQASVRHWNVRCAPFDLAIRKESEGPAKRGSNLRYVISVKNLGPNPTSGAIQVVDTMAGGNGLFVYNPNTGQFQTVINGGLWPVSTNVGSGPWACSFVSSLFGLKMNVVCVRSANASPMLPGQMETFEIVARVDLLAGKAVTNTVDVSGPGEINTSNNQAVRSDVVQ